ncbi:MAG: biotin--[acetyl-CoA-carboxylase] ligase [Spirochaetaceae bacterium]|jgi:BirA family biotin operon repressor/biotin-[acetyl-CoA-carboxylase] ligase|nr:biotin--[acetyl-CoA-carboxylase] ligase [Spirochaetaceae bacterium]
MDALVRLLVPNPFGAPVYYRETLSSTMDEARRMETQGEPHGTVICAGIQEAGRGRKNRPWSAAAGESLLFTVLLRYPRLSALPRAVTLKAGLALSLAVEDFAPPLLGRLRVKWPNDLMIDSRKAAGVLAEGDGETVYIGIGVNVTQTVFPEAFRAKATSLALALGDRGAAALGPESRFLLLEKILPRLYRELDAPETGDGSWRERLEERLYRRGRPVRFFPGGAGSGQLVEGTLEGIGPEGELLLTPHGASGSVPFTTGELDVYAASPE